MTDAIKTYSIRQIFGADQYVIPLYQRNYAWGAPEITQLIQDIYDAYTEQKTRNYYIGTLVVFEEYRENHEVFYETIDGQQRLTTLNILISLLNRKYVDKIAQPLVHKLNLTFESRKKSTDTLEVMARNTPELQYNPDQDYNPDIQQAYSDAEKLLSKLLPPHQQVSDFYTYLTNRVQVMRVSVPRDTNRNHYFEIMNTRGEQLEKHEVLKAQLLEIIHDEGEALSYTFNLIWEACADMERYVQYGFNTTQRDVLFGKGHWNKPSNLPLSEMSEHLYSSEHSQAKSSNDTAQGLTEILMQQGVSLEEENDTKEKPERFSSIINFANFLLHVLRIQTGKDISLDDKRLLSLFDEALKALDKDEKKAFVKSFGENLLRCKWLFDNYIIKREFTNNRDEWSLRQLKLYNGNKVSYVNTFEETHEYGDVNRELVMLLSMFHVSTPTLVYKHWLNAALFYLFEKHDLQNEPCVSPHKYLTHLTDLARAFLFDRFLAAPDHRVEYYDIIYKHGGKSQNKGRQDTIDTNVLHKGTLVENFVFNLLDFILWKEKVSKSDEFNFAFRSSVEHYYPQNPIAGNEKIEQSTCDHFGNLCLISRSKNSKLSHHLPEAKKDYYHKAGPDSLKQNEMMKHQTWKEPQIESHGNEMIKKLLDF